MTLEIPDRRTVLCGAAILGAGAALTSCAGGGGGGGPTSEASDPSTTGAEVGKASEVPVGGAKIFPDAKVVVTQPSAGEFAAFSAVCTHQGCLVSSVTADTIDCACHGSSYSIKDGSVVGGPAPEPLASATVTNEAGILTLG